MNRGAQKKSLHFFLLLFFAVAIGSFFPFGKVAATGLLSPFGGKVRFWMPEAFCPAVNVIGGALSVATGFTLNLTVEKLDIEGTKGLGFIVINGVNVFPNLVTQPKVYRNYLKYRIPFTWVVGNAFDIDFCNICKSLDKIPAVGGLLKNLIGPVCEVPGFKTALSLACSISSAGCPTKLVFNIGSGGRPDPGK